MINLVSKTTGQLNLREINSICVLKNTQWKFGVKSQLKWFKRNIKSFDIHNLFFLKNKLVGYTLLRKRNYISKNLKKKYLLFDTLIIKKEFRKKKYSTIMMNFNNEIIKHNNCLSYLMCAKNLVSFYKKYNWKKLNNSSFVVVDHPFNTNGMIFNYNNTTSKLKFYIN